jgi:ATP-binding cassette, subfamily G (WHITE), member 2, SNQ2
MDVWSASPALERQETGDKPDRFPLHNSEQHDEREESEDSSESDSTRIASPKNGPDVRESGTPEAGRETGDFALGDFLREGHFEKRVDGHSAKRIGVIYKNLTVKGIGITATFVKTLPDAIVGTFGPDLYRLLCRFLPFLSFDGGGATRTLIHDFTGVVRDGEMLLVLGRPGSGCSTFLKTLANDRKHYEDVIGEVTYGGISAEKQKDMYSGEVNYNPEDDIHLPELNVWQTLTFALMDKTKKRNRGEIPVIADALMRMFGIGHTKYTKVGNEFVPGVSGGERKRVSIAETLATKSAILCFDNPTRGLDGSTALNFAKSLRIITDVSKKATIMTLYQAGEEIYEQMDKVLVIDAGRCIFQGPAKNAKQYFIDLGFYCSLAQTTADFLTSCTDPGVRRFREGYADRAPKTPEELEATFKESQSYQKVLREVELYEQELEATNFSYAGEFKESVQQAKSHRTVSRKSPYTVSFLRQVHTCLRREFWLFFGDTTALYTKAFVIIAIGFIIGSLFYGSSLDSSGAFTRSGALFMSVLFLCWLQLAELMKVFSGRTVIARQHEYALYRPSAVTTARVIMDFVVLLPQVSVFAIIMYFMCSLDVDASKFWTYWLVIYLNTLAITSLYRMFGSLSPTIDDAVRFASVALNLLIIYSGYVIPKPQLISQYIWFGWINYLNPLAYAFEALEANEFANRNITCNPSQLIPQQVLGGPPIDPAHQGCSLTGSPIDATNIPGSNYLESTYNYERSHLWRNFGVLIAFTVLYILVTAFATEVFNFAKEGGGVLMFARNKRSKKALKRKAPPRADIEEGGRIEESSASSRQTEAEDVSKEKALTQISSSQQIFTWENVNYSVPFQGGQMQLLNNVDGYCKPGVMIALMGVSGAGKTTLLNTLSQRQTFGVVSGNMLVDGKPPSSTFQRSTGFCEQMDLHDNTATIREAFEFSALLRQDRNISRPEKIAYVNTIIDLLELSESQDIVISCLSLEQRKRLAIGVELAAKPSLLLFLDEPTSGLDSQSAYSIVQILRKLSTAGQAILCTIHQPSSILIQQFDMILALNPGGNTFYFGPVGEAGLDVTKYFAERGFECPPHKNIAEFLLETAADSRRPDGSKIHWNEEWRNSNNAKALKEEIRTINATRSQVPGEPEGTQYEFAAPVATQTIELTKRLFRQHWRDPSYLYGKLFTAAIMGIFNGFTFWQLGNSTVDMQNRMFSSFMIVTLPATVVNTVVPKFFQNMMLWMIREHPSRIYGWFAFTTAQVVGEIPVAIFSSVLYWLLWYWPALGTQGHSTESSTAGYVFFMTMLFFLFMASWGQWITAFAPSFTVIANTLPLFFIMVPLFNGVVRPYSSLPVFWKYTMYYVNPSQWWISGVLASVLHDLPVYCAENEMIQFTPPAGQTCGQYAGAFANAAGGNLTNPSATDVCNYCGLRSGDQYLASLSISPDDKWRDFGIFCIFVVSNYLLVYFLMWSVRIKGWGFGMGYLFGFLAKIAGFLLSPFKKLASKKRQ